MAGPPVLKAGKSERSALSVRLASAPQDSVRYGELLERQQASLLNWSRWRESRAGSTPALSSERSGKVELLGGTMVVMESSSDVVFPS